MEIGKAEPGTAEQLQQIWQAQQSLRQQALAVSQFLKFALELSTNNLMVIQSKLFALKQLCDGLTAENPLSGEGEEKAGG